MPNVALTGRETRFRPIREIDYRALRLLTERSVGSSPLKVERQVRALDKAWRQGRLGYPAEEPTDWQWRMCEARMVLGDYSDWRGWEYRSEWAAGLWWNPEGSWQGQRVERLCVLGEQGIGDEVCFAQALLDIRDKVGAIEFQTDPRLVGVIGRMGVEAVPALFVDGVRKFKAPEIPWIPLGDLLRNFRRSLSQFPRKPYITALPEQVERFKAYRGRVGVSWRGAQGSYPLSEFASLVAAPVGLQYDLAWDEEVETPDLDLRNDVEGLLGVLSNLDRLVTVSTSIAHFAGALGVKTDLILAPMNGVRKNMLPFKWLCEALPGETPWYGPNVRVFRNMREYRARLQSR